MVENLESVPEESVPEILEARKKMADESKAWVKEFSQCPHCGSEERYFEGIIKGLKERKLLAESIQCFDFQRRRGIGLASDKIAILPIGSEIPSFNEVWDICKGCGLHYSTHLEIGSAKKGLAPTLITPNRAQRRAGMEPGFPDLNSPFLS